MKSTSDAAGRDGPEKTFVDADVVNAEGLADVGVEVDSQWRNAPIATSVALGIVWRDLSSHAEGELFTPPPGSIGMQTELIEHPDDAVGDEIVNGVGTLIEAGHRRADDDPIRESFSMFSR